MKTAIQKIRCEIFGVTQVEMADILGTSQATISRWEAGIGEPSLNHIQRVRAEALRRQLEWDDRLLFPAEGCAA